MQAQLPLVAQLRETLWQNGYRAVAIPIGKKFPVDIAWTEKARENPPKVLSEYNPAKPGTGILCDGLRAIDIDIDDEAGKLDSDFSDLSSTLNKGMV